MWFGVTWCGTEIYGKSPLLPEAFVVAVSSLALHCGTYGSSRIPGRVSTPPPGCDIPTAKNYVAFLHSRPREISVPLL